MSAVEQRRAAPVALRRLPVDGDVTPTFAWLAVLRPGIRVLVPLLVVVVWQTTSSLADQVGFQLPSPLDVVAGFRELWHSGDIQSAVPASLGRAGAGLALGLLVGLIFGLTNGLVRLSEELFDSTLQIVRVIPFIAMVPLFLVWFGIGETLKLVLISLACVFPAYINTYGAVRQVDHKLVEVGQTFGISRLRIVVQIILPAALPTILIGVRYAMGTSLLALIVAEQVNSNAGIGHIIYVASNALRIDLIMVGIVMYAALGILVDVFMRLVERFSMPWIARGTK
ncbi:ABC transporter permease subunit (plasmid) [Burkholderia multivorans]|uniref:ABC transporter permease n=1 Tax=Burkholderia multivorans TaxID=87883 RepID=UPI00201A016A|nr:ABC transporter permease subunit [Burkholderia multivorans]MCO1459895.1 ABC transporter permease subunit [Burkholderia multivorans]UQO21306.1 ABC transporter permease subunit [Burkholderia multivorans]HEM7843192.1 ABC transporter permease subunit [Burkholderia multivorans]HEM7908530.1 ABC transporter permease subunit [Burkholderia multivorans]